MISGYLVSNILSNYNNDNGLRYIFSFYGKRIKRLFPSSFICLVCYYIYHPTLSKHSLQETILYYDIISALLCFSNIRFYNNALSYYQNENSSILINYWSLSLEEQFYFLLPLCLRICNNVTLIILSLSSFIIVYYLHTPTTVHPIIFLIAELGSYYWVYSHLNYTFF